MLVVGLISAVYLVGQQQNLQNQATSGQIDILPFLTGKHAIGGSDPQALGFTNYVVGNALFTVKGSSSTYEYRTWDANNIYLKQDTSVGNFTVPGSGGKVATSYKLSPGTWLHRSMNIGERLVVPNQVDWYDSSCNVVAHWNNWQYTMTLEADKTMDFGGDVGKTEVIVVHYDYGSGSERFYYSKDWGWVRWEEFDGSNKLTRSTDVNRLSSFKNLTTKCGTAQPNVKIPSPTPSPSPSPSPTPSPSPSPAPSPAPPPTPVIPQESCPNAQDPACYDCNKDGEVNILDFTCFKRVYGQKT